MSGHDAPMGFAPPARPFLLSSGDTVSDIFLGTTDLKNPFILPPGAIHDYNTLFTTQVSSLSSKAVSSTTTKKDFLSWPIFVASLPHKNQNDPNLKSLFSHYTRLISTWIGGADCPADLLHSALHIVYSKLSLLNRFAYTDNEKRELEGILGPIKQPAFKEIFDLSLRLRQERQDLMSDSSSSTTSTPSSPPPVVIDHIPMSARPNYLRIQDLEKAFSHASRTGESFGASLTLADPFTSAPLPPFAIPPRAYFAFDPAVFTDPARAEEYEKPAVVDEARSNSSSASFSPLAADAPAPGSWLWLLQLCEPLATFTEDGAPLLSERSLASSALTLLKSPRGVDAVQGELLDLLGFEAFEAIAAMLEHREALRRVSVGDGEALVSKESGIVVKTKGKKAGPAGVGLTITSEDAKKQAKEQRRRLRRFARLSAPAGTGPHRAAAQPASRRAAMDASKDKLIASLAAYKYTGESDLAGLPEGLPEGCKRERDPRGWEEVFVPAQPRAALPEQELVPVSTVDERVRGVFKGVQRFNTLQSQVFDCAYRNNHNMLVCAPTGAGKTNVALLTVAREITANIVDGTLQKGMFKVVYVAPMKALAQEVAEKFSRALACMGVSVRELTGDMQLTKKEIVDTQVLVTTPEKWDVITRKSSDNTLMALVKLLILDEVHLLHEDRGPVIEVLVARTHRHIEMTQQACRIVGLSATLPNYKDVARFLCVPEQGLFHFDARYRPVPLQQHYIGVAAPNPMRRQALVADICYERCVASLQALNQVMVFVTARRDTVRTAQQLLFTAREKGELAHFDVKEVAGYHQGLVALGKASNTPVLSELARDGVGVHHAGMTRAERLWMERAFMDGRLSVLVCTSTLAWGVNLPAHTVIVKGTQIYDAKRGGWCDMGMADVMQIFGRAGRPQFDTSGEAILITAHDRLHHYLSLLTAALPIESQMVSALADHLNAEIVLGSVSNLREADTWLTYTYLYTRMLRNPTAYGVSLEALAIDPTLAQRRRELILNTAKTLMVCRMVKFDYKSGNFFPTDVGRVASLYYIHHQSVETYNRLLKPFMRDEEVVELLAHSREFSQLKVREEEADELLKLKSKGCAYPPISGLDSYVGKANILIQCYLSNCPVPTATLQSDQYFIQQSLPRIARALFEMVLRKGKAALTAKLLEFCKVVERRLWPHMHPLRQFAHLKPSVLRALELKGVWLDELTGMEADEVGLLTNTNEQTGKQVLTALGQVPWLDLHAEALPLTRDVAKVVLTVSPQFQWHGGVHGEAEHWWVWVEEPDSDRIFHQEPWVLTRDMMRSETKLTFTIPLFEPLPPQYIVRVVSDRWLGSDISTSLNLDALLLPEDHPPHTDLLPLNPLPVTALQNPRAEQLYARFTHFNPIQTQLFHCLYHTDESALVGAPTGSGKTVLAELAMLRALNAHAGGKIVYIAPMKALVRERYLDWSGQHSFRGVMGCAVVELTGDANPDPAELARADILITTPEKWDGLTRQWRHRSYIRSVVLTVIDEIHLLGQDRGPVLEVIVSRMRYMTAALDTPLRLVGLSTALSNAHQVARWMGAPPTATFNFHPVMRPVPLSIYIAGFPGKHYCPRMATMNKPTYAAIATHSPEKPVLVFVSSRRQTRLTGLDLIAYASADGRPRRFLRMSDEEVEAATAGVSDSACKHLLSFGIGVHHAGLTPEDRAVVEALFVSQRIQVLICTATLAWGVNFPAHLVVIKGTEYFDPKTCKYVDFPVTDVLQMMGRAGRPQFDQDGKAVVLVHEPKKAFYHKFLHSPFPVESCLHEQLHNHLCAEVAQGSITCLQDAVDWLSWTFFFTRLVSNPSYYGLTLPKRKRTTEDTATATTAPGAAADGPGSTSSLQARLQAHNASECDVPALNAFVLQTLGKALGELEKAGCIEVCPTTHSIACTSMGALASYYYLDYRTVQVMQDMLSQYTTFEGMVDVLCASAEYSNMPVRHNEDVLNAQLMPQLHYALDSKLAGDPHVKTHILLQCRWGRVPLPIADYLTDTLTVLAQAVRVLHALVDMCGDAGWLQSTLNAMLLTQSVVQGVYPWEHPLANLPGATPRVLALLHANNIDTLPQLAATSSAVLLALLTDQMGASAAKRLAFTASCLPRVRVALSPAEDWAQQHRAQRVRNHVEGRVEDGAIDNANAEVFCEAGGVCVVRVGLVRENGWGGQPLHTLVRASAPKVLGPSDVSVAREGWWLLVGNEADDELLAMKKVSVGVVGSVVELEVAAPQLPGTYSWEVVLVSDCYLGLDQQYTVTVHVTKPPLVAAEDEHEYPDFSL